MAGREEGIEHPPVEVTPGRLAVEADDGGTGSLVHAMKA
jgi:hypothetical protein